jgi:hypothetical protein
MFFNSRRSFLALNCDAERFIRKRSSKLCVASRKEGARDVVGLAPGGSRSPIRRYHTRRPSFAERATVVMLENRRSSLHRRLFFTHISTFELFLTVVGRFPKGRDGRRCTTAVVQVHMHDLAVHELAGRRHEKR